MLRMKIKISEQLELASQIPITHRTANKRVNRTPGRLCLTRLRQVFGHVLNRRTTPAGRPEQIWLLENSRQMKS